MRLSDIFYGSLTTLGGSALIFAAIVIPHKAFTDAAAMDTNAVSIKQSLMQPALRSCVEDAALAQIVDLSSPVEIKIDPLSSDMNTCATNHTETEFADETWGRRFGAWYIFAFCGIFGIAATHSGVNMLNPRRKPEAWSHTQDIIDAMKVRPASPKSQGFSR